MTIKIFLLKPLERQIRVYASQFSFLKDHMIAVIIGATGLVGNTLLARIIESEQYSKVLVIGRSEPNLVEHQFGAEKVQFIDSQLDELHELTLADKVDHAFCCLGTTIKQAGSEEAFIQVDKLAVLAFAKLCQTQANPSLKFMVVTSLGADAKSSVFYNRIKGEVEQALKALSLPIMNIFQPSLLLGPRDNRRLLEDIGQTILGGLSFLFIGPLRQYQPIDAQMVAESMYQVALKPQVAPTTQIITNAMMHRCHYS
ncbi:MAG: hypothetical protein ACJASB_000330 [Shewanella psychromarinicola]|jgi:uncharacterized protein YbjT (DUF2867 family)